MVGYNIFFIGNAKLDKQKEYIRDNIKYTKTAYDISIDEVNLNNTGTITDREISENQEVINNIPIMTEKVVLNNLKQTQTSKGYYTYNKAKSALYGNNLSYVSARELDVTNTAENYTHGYGAIITSASETDETGNVKYVSRDFENANIKEPRIYYGTENSRAIILSENDKEFDYPKGTANADTYSYNGEGGVSLNLIDRICVGIEQKNLGLILTNSSSKILLNRNIIQRAEKIMPYLLYDEEPYLVISDDGNLYWVIDAYTTSNDFPYSQKTKFAYGNETKEISYIRNSVKVIVNAFDGDTKFYITDKTDPIAMVYNNMYDTLFEDGSKIPTGISSDFTYSEFLYKIQSDIITMYHDVSPDVLYRGNDVWEIASYSNLITRTAGAEMKPYYTMVKTADSEESKLGLVIAYNQFGKESLNSYLVGTVEDGKNKLSLYKFSADSSVLGPMQLDSLIEQDERVASEVSSLSVTGTKITKEMIIVPIDNTLLYVVPIYQTSLNETNSVPVLKKVVVASGNKVALGDNLTKAISNLMTPNTAVSVDVEDNSTEEGLIDSIIKANNNLIESNGSNDWSQMGRDIEALQTLVKQLENMRKENENKSNNVNNTVTDGNNTVDGNSIYANTVH